VFTAPAEFKQLQLIGKYHLGYTYFLLQDHVHSAEYLQQFIDQDASVSGKRFRPYAAFMLGFDYWMLDMRDKVPPLYAQIKSWVRDNQSFDRYALRRAENFLKTGKFTKFEELFIGAAALHEGKNYSASLKTIEQVIPLLKEEPNNRDQYALYYWLKGSCLRGLKKLDRATSMFEVRSQIWKSMQSRV
jgi:tetratricopeptide (TPR) repeat protein